MKKKLLLSMVSALSILAISSAVSASEAERSNTKESVVATSCRTVIYNEKYDLDADVKIYITKTIEGQEVKFKLKEWGIRKGETFKWAKYEGTLCN
ncbi:hypothetical protein O0555_02160 [Brevibacillus laterosporus]|uniref:SH3 domain-containing protein n=1 Tax=Brevibacillus laterosporus TaxID=1465 RepID=A0AAP3GCU0_BRELA|nr:hypothetical protein [Brevibacillus laterosporus]MBG9797492.1 hypothetical protein [Brevibacillus laterosporus]MCR8936158.1 hypothetical protein [Brevibacillus laterosporus]MCR8981975.1 hypothetical protein [Brevibacillus laterosporus]MCZ0809130.1 hypothetical protein [Brevibacillus laterosporus]MCZ0827529.1 hypothetical protein [Brevibacillus laterosporus]